MKNLKTMKKNIIRKMKYNYKYKLVEFLFEKDLCNFLLNDYFEDYRKNYINHNKRIEKNGFCLSPGYRNFSCEFCEYTGYRNKIISKYNFYFDKDIKELLKEFE